MIWISEFHPNLVGLTGTSDDVRQVARAYRVYYMKTEDEGSDYLVDHSIVMYVFLTDSSLLYSFSLLSANATLPTWQHLSALVLII